jgi:putative transposase
MAGARKFLAWLAYLVPRLKRIWADATYRGKEVGDWCQLQGGS